MSEVKSKILQPPFSIDFLTESGSMNQSWVDFFSLVSDLLTPMGQERSFQLENNQASDAPITGMAFNYKHVSLVTIEYLVQRITTSTGATEKNEAGILQAVYEATSNSWSIGERGTPGPDDAGITFSITAEGQVQYTTSNITGTNSFQKITWRARTLNAKNGRYS